MTILSIEVPGNPLRLFEVGADYDPKRPGHGMIRSIEQGLLGGYWVRTRGRRSLWLEACLVDPASIVEV